MKKSKLSTILSGKIDSKLLDRIDTIFNNDRIFDEFILNINSTDLLKVFHLIYKDVKRENIYFGNSISKKLERLSNKYIQSVHKKYIPLNILDNLDDKHSYSKEYSIIAEEIPLFSLKEAFSYENSKKYCRELNGVTLITPTRTISTFCEKFYDDVYGTGFHDKRLSQISRAIYCKNFENAQSGSDIQIRYVNKPAENKHHTISVMIEVPYPINSSQLKSLEYLNEEIKKYHNDKKVTFEVDCAIRDYFNNVNNNYDIKTSDSLDLLFQNITVDNNFKTLNEQKYRLGYPNYENHYNDSNYKLCGEIIKKRIN